MAAAVLSCGHPWPLTAKYWHQRQDSPDGFQPRCKGCDIAAVRKWQASHRERYLRSQHEYASPLRAELIDFKESHPCVDCGLCYPYVCMSFDHTGQDKVSDVGKMAKGNGHLRGRARLLAEIAKCDLVCSNCHALRTHERRLAKAGASSPGPARTPLERAFRRAGHPMDAPITTAAG
jgi:hypothetical protein